MSLEREQGNNGGKDARFGVKRAETGLSMLRIGSGAGFRHYTRLVWDNERLSARPSLQE